MNLLHDVHAHQQMQSADLNANNQLLLMQQQQQQIQFMMMQQQQQQLLMMQHPNDPTVEQQQLLLFQQQQQQLYLQQQQHLQLQQQQFQQQSQEMPLITMHSPLLTTPLITPDFPIPPHQSLPGLNPSSAQVASETIDRLPTATVSMSKRVATQSSKQGIFALLGAGGVTVNDNSANNVGGNQDGSK
eukprot:GDKJ01047384.1.p1 GENE.GDKJ01047384.1~~GDKJ01047384.1.p1  ORF type:complete len:195 (-),score=83.22 GDKJ01047384.1:109-669(-)